MSKSRSKVIAEFKTRAALDALSGEHTLSELFGKHGVHPIRFSRGSSRPKNRLRWLCRRGPEGLTER